MTVERRELAESRHSLTSYRQISACLRGRSGCSNGEFLTPGKTAAHGRQATLREACVKNDSRKDQCRKLFRGGRVVTKRRYSVLILLVMATGSALAHHSDAGFDMQSAVAIRGVVTEFSWRNPHVYVTVDVTEPNGEVTEWQFQSAPTMRLARSGWTPDLLQPGDRVVARGHPERDPDRNTARRYAFLLTIEKEDGTILERGRAGQPETAIATDLNGRWRAASGSFDALIDAYQRLPVTEKGALAKAEYDIYADEGLQSCEPMPTPVSPVLAADIYVAEIEVTADTVFLRSEYYDTERVVYMDGRRHPEDGERTLHGHSIGWWEDGVLVVDTANFADHRSPLQDGLPSGAQRHVVERYDLSDDGTALMIDVLVEDPEYLAAPLHGTVEWKYTPDAELLRYNCDPEVSRQFAFQ